MNFFQRPLTFTSRFTLPSRAILSPLEGIMNRENFFHAALAMHLIDSWMPPFIGIPKDAPPKSAALRKRFKFFLESGIPFTVQILGHDPDSIGEACRTLSDLGIASVNVNCACPSPTVVSSGSGAALLRQPEVMKQILQTIRRAIPELCLSVKLRSGFDSAGELSEILAAVREGGPHWVIHHFRTASENYAGIPQNEAVKRLQTVRELLPQTVFFANGDIHSAEDAEFYRRECLCDGVAIGRGILRNPYLLRTILTGEIPSVDLRREFLKQLTHGIVNRRRDHFLLECVKMAYGEDSFEFMDCLKSIQNHKRTPW